MLLAKIFALLLGIVGTVSAHGSGPPYVMVEGEYAKSNPILSYAQPTTLTLGADVASSSGYLVGETLLFDIDLMFFPNPYAPVAGSQAGGQLGLAADMPTPQFRWDFGDGSEPEVGTLVSHAYGQAGTYIVDLAARYPGKQETFASVNTIQVDILPTAGYERTRPQIVVNGSMVDNPARDIVSIVPARPVTFEANHAGTPPVSYRWDFGNGRGGEGKTAITRFARDDYFPVAMLRTIDEHGLWSDTYALLDLPLGSPNPVVRLWYAIVDFVMSIITR